MLLASQAHHAVCVLLGGPFAPERSIDPKPLACALLRRRPRLVDAVGQMQSTGSAEVAMRESVRRYG
jgi:hypothetical protein